jgi:hypothetical protein
MTKASFAQAICAGGVFFIPAPDPVTPVKATGCRGDFYSAENQQETEGGQSYVIT